jgi:hypothetical protein
MLWINGTTFQGVPARRKKSHVEAAHACVFNCKSQVSLMYSCAQKANCLQQDSLPPMEKRSKSLPLSYLCLVLGKESVLGMVGVGALEDDISPLWSCLGTAKPGLKP